MLSGWLTVELQTKTPLIIPDGAHPKYWDINKQRYISEKEAEAAGLTSSIASTQQENDRLQSSIDALDTPEGLEQVARDQLGMVSEGEIVFEDVGDS